MADPDGVEGEHGLTVERLDRDGAILDGVERVYGWSRADFLRTTALGAGAVAAALSLPSGAWARSDPTEILNFDLTFEYLQSSFYTEAERVGTVAAMDAETREWARTLGAHERAHVKILKSVLAEQAASKPFFDFGGVTESVESFVRTAVAMEDLTVALLAGQAGRFASRELTAAVFSLLTVEARHAAWARRIRGFVPTVTPFDRPRPIADVRRTVANTNFVRQPPRMRSRRRPRFTG